MSATRATVSVVVAVACVATLAVGTAVAVTGTMPSRVASPGPPSPSPSPMPTTGAPGNGGVAPLNRVVAPDLLVTSPAPIDAPAMRRLGRVAGVTETLRVAAGTVGVGSGSAVVLGVEPSTFRAWTPLASAKSDALWRALAEEQLVLTFEAREARGLTLGDTYAVTAERALPLRLGALAALDLPRVGGLVTSSTARGLGLTDGGAVLVNAPAATAGTPSAVRKALGPRARVTAVRAPRSEPAEPTPTGEPGTYRELYERAASRCPGLSWAVLAAIGQVESDHGRNMGPSTAGALGPMQFLPSTWRSFGVDGNGDGRRDIWDPYDAVPAAADYLCEHGAGRGGAGLSTAVFAYNHSDSYVRQVLDLAEAYAGSS
ncbi:MAG: transglycosylase SLT domain-containing protein [Streptosporangiales bacterium]|nr:transglycosylase SLT domain-containing protein [Streptosporangiales bacterium]